MLPILCRWPILAYLPHRGVQEALYIAFDFCATIRSLCMEATAGPWTTLAGSQRPGLCGGLLFSLDMKQAFDRLSRSALRKGLHLSHCPPEITELFLHWLDQAKYHVHHRGHHHAIPTTCGVRQGCKASPLQWTAFLMYLMHEFGTQHLSGDPEVYRQWMIEHLLTYADDLLLRWKIDSEFALQDALTLIGHLLDMLVTMGMEISLEKTVVLLRLTGLKAKQILKRHVHWFRGCRWLAIPRKTHTQYVQIVPCARLSFFAFEQATLIHRLQIGRAAYGRLKYWFQGHHGFSHANKAQLWTTCIRSSYCHALQCTGLTKAGLDQLHGRMCQDLRRVGKSPAHITHETTEDLYRRLGICAPKVYLQDSWSRALDRLRHLQTGLAADDFLQYLPVASIEQRLMKVFADPSQREPDAPVEATMCTL